MIWVGGRIVPAADIKVSVLDRTFEHGIGLFETLRTWKGFAPLLDRHLRRMSRSARELGIPIDSVVLPTNDDVASLLSALKATCDVMLRITISGGIDEHSGATLWMRALPLPTATKREGAVVDLGSWRIQRDDLLNRHKTLNYWSRRQAYEYARKNGFDEVLGMTLGWTVWEGSRTNVFVVRDSTLTTPTQEGPIVPGIMRGLVLELAKSQQLTIMETNDVTKPAIAEADEVFLTNSVRGIIPVARVGTVSYSAHGNWTSKFTTLIADWVAERVREGRVN